MANDWLANKQRHFIEELEEIRISNGQNVLFYKGKNIFSLEGVKRLQLHMDEIFDFFGSYSA